MTALFQQPLWVRILVSMVLGVILGFGIRADGFLDGLIDGEAWSAALKLIGDAFIRLACWLLVWVLVWPCCCSRALELMPRRDCLPPL